MNGTKHDSGKPQFSLIPQRALLEVAKVVTFGAETYGVENWKDVPDLEQRFTDAALRHMNAYLRGELLDQQTKLYHLACAITSLMFVLETDIEKTDP